VLTRPLLPFQDQAVTQFLDRGSLLLALSPGMGKTVIAIAAAEELLGTRQVSTCLCVVPASLKYQWGQKLAEFTDLPACQVKAGGMLITVPAPPGCVIIDGSEQQRDRQYAAISSRTEYVILGYPNILNDWAAILPLQCGMVVLDECTAVKNPGSDISRAVREAFPAAGPRRVPWRLALTGTPVENKPEELYSLLEWISPGYLGHPAVFDKAFVRRRADGSVLRYKNLPALHQQLKPVMYRKRRSDPDVASYFPREDEDVWLVPLPPQLRDAYRVLAADLLASLRSLRRRGGRFDITAAYRGGKPDESTPVGRIAAKMQAMEMLTCHPSLILQSAAAYRESVQARGRGARKAAWPGSWWCSQVARSGILDGPAGQHAPKLRFLLDRCAEILSAPRTRVLVYTKYASMLPVMAAAFAAAGTGTVCYSGSMTAQQKTGAISRFTADPACRVFLSSHAGAYGCDMHMASHLINYDIPWSGGKAEQINGRHVRASNGNQVIYIRHLLAEGSLDQRKLAQVRLKHRVATAIVDGRGADSLGQVDNDIGTLAKFLERLLDA
jgi:SNF2 family DNA or RNA helicase